MRWSVIAFVGGLVAAGCLLPPLDLEGLACSEQQTCSGTFVCVEGRCREPEPFSARDAGAGDAGATLDAGTTQGRDGGTCAAWTGTNFCADFDDFQQGPGWQLGQGSSVTMVTYPDPNGPTGSARLVVSGQSHAFLRSPSVSFGPADITSVVRATASFVLDPGAQPVKILSLRLANQHRLVLVYEGGGNGSLTEERPDGGRSITHAVALPANGGSLWVQVVGDFRRDGGVWLGVNQDWSNVASPALVAIHSSREAAALDVGIVSADGGGALTLDFAALETW